MTTPVIITLIICATLVVLCGIGTISNIFTKNNKNDNTKENNKNG